MRRNINLLRLFGNIYIVLILGYIVFAYYTLMYKNVLVIPDKSILTWIHIGFLHTALFLLLSCFFQTIISDPGKVPLFWGFFLDDPDNKRRRYCLICHIFKPERSHHCSACNRCVLNMDHHCPWLNNCIGFYNRKFFLLLLFYTILIKAETMIYYLPIWIRHFETIIDDRLIASVDHYLTFVCYMINCGMLIVISMFFRFHLTLIRDNMTTIEHMDKKRGAEARSEAVNYDMGVYYNFIQIFGKNPWLWLLPVFLSSGRPVGDGVVWPMKPANAQRYEIDMSIRNVTANKDTSEQGSAAKDRVSPLRAGVLTPNNDRNQTPFSSTSAPRQPDYHSQTYNPPIMGNSQPNFRIGGGFTSDDRSNMRPFDYGNYENQPSDRNRPYNLPNQGLNFNTGRGSLQGQQQNTFDQTQQIEQLPPRVRVE